MLLTILPLNSINSLVVLLYKHDGGRSNSSSYKKYKTKLCLKNAKKETKAKQIWQQQPTRETIYNKNKANKNVF